MLPAITPAHRRTVLQRTRGLLLPKCYALKHGPECLDRLGRELAGIDGSVQGHVRERGCSSDRAHAGHALEHPRFGRRIPHCPESPNDFCCIHGVGSEHAENEAFQWLINLLSSIIFRANSHASTTRRAPPFAEPGLRCITRRGFVLPAWGASGQRMAAGGLGGVGEPLALPPSFNRVSLAHSSDADRRRPRDRQLKLEARVFSKGALRPRRGERGVKSRGTGFLPLGPMRAPGHFRDTVARPNG
jgi:hypothetical protein